MGMKDEEDIMTSFLRYFKVERELTKEFNVSDIQKSCPSTKKETLSNLYSELSQRLDETTFERLYEGWNGSGAFIPYFVRKALPIVLKWCYKTDLADFRTVAQQSCSLHFNAPTIQQAIALSEIAYREAPITLRGCFYRAVSAGNYPDTADKHYRQCGNILVKLRRSGIVAYPCIVDGTRYSEKPSSWSGMVDYLETVSNSYRCDLWQRQADYIEIFVEKDAMAAVLLPVTREYDVRLNIIRGSCSETFAWNIAQQWQEIKKPIYAYYLGDHDPSGLSIENDLKRRLTELAEGIDFEWERIAINEEDFHRTDLIGFPIKGDRNTKDWQTKHRDYLQKYGDRCVEVDAVPSTEIRQRVRQTIEYHINQAEWQALKQTEVIERQSFKEIVLAQKNLTAEKMDKAEGEP